ncbi:MAG: class I SAM-dependent methyltransferase [Proteobacteria bacterium]|nr:class I SAM-dependent methyltransferase [bacterium]MBU4036442.1 class I SAM-dependent methyltransferase [Pseudomonadota bacterium]
MESKKSRCILCNSSEREELLTKDSWQVYRCISCGLGVLDPRPTKEEIVKLYGQEIVKLYGQDYYAEPGLGELEQDSPEFVHRLSLESSRIRFVRSQKKKGELLDMGCGNANFLAACQKKGFSVQGMDISDYAVKYAREKLKIQISVGDVGDVKMPHNYFDVITMWHFLEHTENPREVILQAKQWLKKDGIMIIEVPNYESTDAKAERENWVDWQLPYHLFHFTPSSLRQLLKETGFKVIKTKNYHSESVKNRLAKIPIIKLISREIARFYSGTGIAMIAKKNE